MIRVNQKTFKRFGHKCMNEERLIEAMYMLDVEGRKHRGRPCSRWLEGDNKSYNIRSLKLKDVKVKIMVREQWRDFENRMTDLTKYKI